ncbi:MAG: ATP-binding protein [Candidatus Thiodiazotropha sp.]
MLLEFRVKNYKSIRDEAIFSLVASKDKSLQQTNTMETGIRSIPFVTCSAAVYGANASGKSNLINALGYMRAVVAESAALQAEQTFNVKPFLFDPETKDEPTEFEITFVKDGIRYQYGFSMTAERIMEEWLLVYKTAKPQNWFSRYYEVESGKDVFELGSGLRGQKTAWRDSTRKNSLFLSIAVQLNSEQLLPVYSWIIQDLVIFGAQGIPSNDFTIQMVQSEQGKLDVKGFLISADISIDDISVIQKKGIRQSLHYNTTTGKSETNFEEKEFMIPQFKHTTEKGDAILELHEESLGTQRLFALSGPILDILKTGKVLIFDELDSSLHALLARRLVELFHTSEINHHGAQLVFTTHDTALLRGDLLRRDQVWFIEKNSQQSSVLYPLTDFSPRKGESIEKGYLIGRYGAVPFLGDLDLTGTE